MFFYVLMVPSLFVLVFILIKLNKMKKHDLVLYRFCQIRRDAIWMIDNRSDSLSRKEYAFVRSLLDCSSIMIHDYEKCKSSLFNFRRFIKFLKSYKEKTHEADVMKIPSDAAINDLHNKYRHALVMAFLAYTPYIRSEFMIRMMIGLFVILGKLGVKSVANGVGYLRWAGEELKKMKDDDFVHA